MSKRFDDLQYIADIALLERVVQLRAPIERQAGIFDSIGSALGWMAQEIQRYVFANIDTSSTGNLALSVLNLAAAYMLGRRSLLLGLLYGVADAMGFGLDDIIKKMISGTSALLAGNRPIAAEDLNRVANNLIQSEAPRDSSSADDIVVDAFAPLRELERKGQLFAFAAGPLDIFRMVGRYRTYSLIVHIVKRILQTFLLSAGLLVGGGVIAETLGLAKPQATPTEKSQEIPSAIAPSTIQISTLPAMPTPVGLEPSGRGEEYHPNDEHTSWVIPVYGSVVDTVISWATQIYPELAGHEDVIEATPSFNRMVNILSSNLDYRTPNYLLMPKGIHRRIDVINSFAGDVVKRLPQNIQV